MIAAGVGVALLSGGVGAGIGLALRSSPSTVISTPGGGSSSSNGGTMSAAAIAAAVDPSLVDINDVIGGTRAAGTGIIVTPSGEVLTNNHVIDGATDITAQIDGQGTIYQVKVLGYDNAADVALLQIEGAPTLQAAPLGNSSSAQVGSSIVVLGNALGQGGTPAEVTGTVTALDQTVTASDGDTSETLNGTIQIQANIEPGELGWGRGRQRREDHRHDHRRLDDVRARCCAAERADHGLRHPHQHRGGNRQPDPERQLQRQRRGRLLRPADRGRGRERRRLRILAGRRRRGDRRGAERLAGGDRRPAGG